MFIILKDKKTVVRDNCVKIMEGHIIDIYIFFSSTKPNESRREYEIVKTMKKPPTPSKD